MLEQIIGLIAPDYCRNCLSEGVVLCQGCLGDVMVDNSPCCYMCNMPSNERNICTECLRRSPFDRVWIAAEHQGLVAELMHDFKFERVRAAARPFAQSLAAQLPYLPDSLIVPVATAPQRVRVRGYDQTLLVARELSKLTDLAYVVALRRNHNKRQVGATRDQRMAQAKDAFRVHKPEQIKGKRVLLVDDVVTTGATLDAAAKVLLEAGAIAVDAAVVARHTLPK